MAPTTDPAPGVQEFYDSVAGSYDRMTGFEKRFISERPFFKLLVEKYGIRKALDAGAGTGFHSLLLAELGVETAAVDLSAEMVARLQAHARERGVTIDGRQGSFAALPDEWSGRFDALFCLGNSLPHLLTQEELAGSLRAFRRVLRSGGTLFLQLLNYDRILAERERIVGAKEDGTETFVRFYDFGGEDLRFNILRLSRTESGIRHRLEGVTLHPWKPREISDALRWEGFEQPGEFGGMSMEPFEPERSRDCVVVATAR